MSKTPTPKVRHSSRPSGDLSGTLNSSMDHSLSLSKRIKDLEKENKELILKIQASKKTISRLKLERKYLFEKWQSESLLNAKNANGSGSLSLSGSGSGSGNNLLKPLDNPNISESEISESEKEYDKSESNQINNHYTAPTVAFLSSTASVAASPSTSSIGSMGSALGNYMEKSNNVVDNQSPFINQSAMHPPSLSSQGGVGHPYHPNEMDYREFVQREAPILAMERPGLSMTEIELVLSARWKKEMAALYNKSI